MTCGFLPKNLGNLKYSDGTCAPAASLAVPRWASPKHKQKPQPPRHSVSFSVPWQSFLVRIPRPWDPQAVVPKAEGEGDPRTSAHQMGADFQSKTELGFLVCLSLPFLGALYSPSIQGRTDPLS